MFESKMTRPFGRYEYLVLNTWALERLSDSHQHQDSLNYLGARGWELVNVGQTFIFKRFFLEERAPDE